MKEALHEILGVLVDKRFLRFFTILVVVMLYIPPFIMFINSFNENPFMNEWRGFTIKWYTLVLNDGAVREALYNSLSVALVSALISISLAFLAGLISRPGIMRALEYLVYPAIIMPEVAEAVSLLLFFIYIHMELGWLTVMLGHTAFNVAFAFAIISIAGVRFPSLEDAAKTLGARPLHILTKIILPLSLPVLLSAFAVTFLLSFTNFVKTTFTRGPGFETLPLLIWARARRPGVTDIASPNALNALASIIFIATLALAVIVSIVYTINITLRAKSEKQAKQ